MKVVARLAEKVDESTQKRHDAFPEDLALMTWRRSKPMVKV